MINKKMQTKIIDLPREEQKEIYFTKVPAKSL
jgi:hypothetical protein